MAERFGGKWTLSLGILSTAVFTLLTPLAIEHGGSTWLIIVRILMGLGEGTTFPALSVLLSSWVPIKERGKLGALVLGGGQVGTIIGTSVSGVLLDQYDWPIVFYVFGGIGVAWFICFVSIFFSLSKLYSFLVIWKHYLFFFCLIIDIPLLQLSNNTSLH